MSRVELLEWIEFYKRWPFDDLHRLHRPAALIAAKLGGGSTDELIEWLEPPSPPEGMSLAEFNTLRAFGMDPYLESET